MRLLLIVGLGCLAQAQVLTVPAGTKIPLQLTGPLTTRTARVGDAVHAETTFPVAAETRVAIPKGTYVDGTIERIRKRGRDAGFDVRFTRIIFSNGYTVPLSGDGTLASAEFPPGFGPTDAPAGVSAFQFPTQPPVLTPPPSPGPNKGLIIGTTVAAAVATMVLLAVLGHRGGGLDLATGAPFEMTLQTPLSLDPNQLPAPSTS
jgi:hypothetical protein